MPEREPGGISRRDFLKSLGLVAGAAVLAPSVLKVERLPDLEKQKAGRQESLQAARRKEFYGHYAKEMLPEESESSVEMIANNENYEKWLQAAAKENGVAHEINFLRAMMIAESYEHKTGELRDSAESRKGAIGLFQLMPLIYRDTGVSDPNDPKQNIFGGVKYFAKLYRNNNYQNNRWLAAAAFNMGETKFLNQVLAPWHEETLESRDPYPFELIKYMEAKKIFPETRMYLKKIALLLDYMDPQDFIEENVKDPKAVRKFEAIKKNYLAAREKFRKK